MIDYKINPVDWYSERKLIYTPKHFTLTTTPITNESELWILSTLTGRYSLTSGVSDGDTDFMFNMNNYPSFEDPKEALIYELKWS